MIILGLVWEHSLPLASSPAPGSLHLAETVEDDQDPSQEIAVGGVITHDVFVPQLDGDKRSEQLAQLLDDQIELSLQPHKEHQLLLAVKTQRTKLGGPQPSSNDIPGHRQAINQLWKALRPALMGPDMARETRPLPSALTQHPPVQKIKTPRIRFQGGRNPTLVGQGWSVVTLWFLQRLGGLKVKYGGTASASLEKPPRQLYRR